MVFAWMPAIAIYFTDPDGHELEFIAILEGKARPGAGVISYEEWMALEKADRPPE
jgi:lactoylglutathione lyase